VPYFLVRLLPPRPTFMQDMTDAERATMQAHGADRGGLMDEGKVLVDAPVLGPRGGWGLGIMEVADEAEVWRLVAGDPVAQAKLGTYEVSPLGVRRVRKGS
jgi:hypothetical protein